MELATAAELGKLLAEADDVYNLRSGVKGDLRFLQTELESLQVALRKMAEVPADLLDDQTKDLASKLRDVFYHTERVVNNFRAHILAHRMRTADPRGLKGLAAGISAKLSLRRARREFATSIRELKHRIQKLHEDRVILDFDSTAARRRAMAEEGQQQLPVADDLVGVDSHRDELVKLLTEEGATSGRQLKVVAIVGDGPVGKTALAKAVFDSLAQQFDPAAWVTLSSRLDIIKILRGLLRQISQEAQHAYFEAMDPKQLIDKIRRTLQDKRYLIVLDDILDEPEWELLKCALIDTNQGSAVLTTSRKVGHIAHFVDRKYELAPLSEIDSRKLFYKRVFGSEDNCPPQLVGIAENFIEKCGGMPLTIITMARLLAGKTLKTKDEWDAFYASISSGLLFDQIISQGFETSEHGLPPHLKPCLLYLSMFPKGCEVRREHLVWQWIAEGFIRETGPQGRTLQELGEHYLNELINRRLIEPVDVDADGRVISCCVASVVHDLLIPMSTEENFVTVLNGRDRTLPNMIHRLSIQGGNAKERPLEGTLSQVRSLVVSGDANLMPSLKEFQDLRVLDLGRCYSLQNEALEDIGILFHLQCLILGGKGVTRIPEKIGDLIFLETMDLRASGVVELPESVFLVRQLKRLYVNSRTRIPHGIAKLEALQELGDINISNTDLLKELCNLTRIKVLKIAIWSWDESYNDPVLEYLRSLVKGKQSIQSLSILTCCSLHFMDSLDLRWAPESLQKLEIRHSTFLGLPGWMDSLQNLTSLSIEVYKLSQHIIDAIGGMSNLSSLSLTSKHAPEGKFGITTEGFRNLTGFHFASKAMGEMFASRAMQMLKRLKLSFQVSHTKRFCFGLENLPSVEHVRVEINCFSASLRVVKDAEAAIQKEVRNSLNLKIQRVQEEYMVESEDESVTVNMTEAQQKETKSKKKSSRRKIRVAAKRLRQKKKGVARKYKIISLQLKQQILTLQAL